MENSFDDLLRQAQERKRGAELRAEQAVDAETSRLAGARARAGRLVPEVDKAIAALRRAGSRVADPGRDRHVNDSGRTPAFLDSPGLGGCAVRFFAQRARFSAEGYPSRWGKVTQPPGWRFSHRVHGGDGSCTGIVAIFVPVSEQPFVTAPASNLPERRLSISEFAEQGRFEWRVVMHELRCSYKVDADQILARFVRAVAAYAAGE